MRLMPRCRMGVSKRRGAERRRAVTENDRRQGSQTKKQNEFDVETRHYEICTKLLASCCLLLKMLISCADLEVEIPASDGATHRLTLACCFFVYEEPAARSV